MRKGFIINNKYILSPQELRRIKERIKILSKLSDKSNIKIKDVLEKATKDDNNIFIFNGMRINNIFRVYEEGEKITNNDRLFKIKDDSIISRNFLAFYLTRPDILKYFELSKKGNFIQFISVNNFLEIPLPKPNIEKKIINSDSLFQILQEFFLAEEKEMYFSVNVLAGAIIEFILEDLISELELPKKVLEKFKMIGGYFELVKTYDLIRDREILQKIDNIRNHRNFIHSNKSKNISLIDIENKAKNTIIDLEAIILYLGL